MDAKFSLTIPITIYDDLDFNILKKETIKKIISLSDISIDENNYQKYAKIVINNQLNIIFINFIDENLIINFCKNFKDKNNKVNICDNEFKIKPNYKYFSKIIVESSDDNLNIDETNLENYIKNKKYINYCFFLESYGNLYNIYFSSEHDASSFINDTHILNDISLNIKFSDIKNNILSNVHSDPSTPEPNNEIINDNLNSVDNIKLCNNAADFLYDTSKKVSYDIENFINNMIYLEKDYENIDEYTEIMLKYQKIISDLYSLKMDIFKLSLNKNN
jgi:hypothetical protein